MKNITSRHSLLHTHAHQTEMNLLKTHSRLNFNTNFIEMYSAMTQPITPLIYILYNPTTVQIPISSMNTTKAKASNEPAANSPPENHITWLLPQKRRNLKDLTPCVCIKGASGALLHCATPREHNELVQYDVYTLCRMTMA